MKACLWGRKSTKEWNLMVDINLSNHYRKHKHKKEIHWNKVELDLTWIIIWPRQHQEQKKSLTSTSKAGGYEMTNQPVKQNGKQNIILPLAISGGLYYWVRIFSCLLPPPFFLLTLSNWHIRIRFSKTGCTTEEMLKPLDRQQVGKTASGSTESTNGAVNSNQAVQVRLSIMV